MRTLAGPRGRLPWDHSARPASFVKATTTRLDGEHLAALRVIVDQEPGVDLWQPVLWPQQRALAAEVGCAETDVSVLLDQIREERGIKPAWHRRYRKHEAKQGRLREARPFLKEKERTMAPKEAPPVRETTEPAAEVTPAVEPVREKAIAEMTLDEVFRLVDPEITGRKGATIRVWEAMKVARVDPRKTISRDQQEAMLVPIGRFVAHNELSEIRAILRSLGWQDRFGHSKGEAFRAAKAPKSEPNGSAQSSELAVPMGSGEMLTDSEVQALAAQTWSDGGHLPVSPHPTADANPDPLVVALQNEVERLTAERDQAIAIGQEWRDLHDDLIAQLRVLKPKIQPLKDTSCATSCGAPTSLVGDLDREEAQAKIERLQGEVERLKGELDQAQAEAGRQSEHAARLAVALETVEVKYARALDENDRLCNQMVEEGTKQPYQPAFFILTLMELLEEITTTVCELRDEADRESVSASDCVAAMVSAFVRTARREVGQ